MRPSSPEAPDGSPEPPPPEEVTVTEAAAPEVPVPVPFEGPDAPPAPHRRRCCAPKTWLTPEEWAKYSALALQWVKNPWHWPLILVALVVVLAGSFVTLLILHIVPVQPESLRLFILEINIQILCSIFAVGSAIMHPQRIGWWYHWHCRDRPKAWQRMFPFHAERPGETLFIIISMNFNCLASEALGGYMWATAAFWQTRDPVTMPLLTILSFGSGLGSGIHLGVRTAQYAKSSGAPPLTAPADPAAPRAAPSDASPNTSPQSSPTKAAANALAADLAIQVGLQLDSDPPPVGDTEKGARHPHSKASPADGPPSDTGAHQEHP